MNERIRELAEQAKRNEPFDCGALTKDQWLEKFAELILEDVMSICEDLGEKGMDGHYCVDAIAKKYSMHQWS